MKEEIFNANLLTLLRHLEATSEDKVPLGRVTRLLIAPLLDEVKRRIEEDRRMEDAGRRWERLIERVLERVKGKPWPTK